MACVEIMLHTNQVGPELFPSNYSWASLVVPSECMLSVSCCSCEKFLATSDVQIIIHDMFVVIMELYIILP